MPYQGVYNRHQEHVVVKDYKIATEAYVKLGQELRVGDLPVHQMRSLFRRKIIGKKDSPWANVMLERAQSEAKEINITDDVSSQPEVDAPKKRGRPKKAQEE